MSQQELWNSIKLLEHNNTRSISRESLLSSLFHNFEPPIFTSDNSRCREQSELIAISGKPFRELTYDDMFIISERAYDLELNDAVMQILPALMYASLVIKNRDKAEDYYRTASGVINIFAHTFEEPQLHLLSKEQMRFIIQYCVYWATFEDPSGEEAFDFGYMDVLMWAISFGIKVGAVSQHWYSESKEPLTIDPQVAGG